VKEIGQNAIDDGVVVGGPGRRCRAMPTRLEIVETVSRDFDPHQHGLYFSVSHPIEADLPHTTLEMMDWQEKDFYSFIAPVNAKGRKAVNKNDTCWGKKGGRDRWSCDFSNERSKPFR
jgi:hypothetical protein